MLQNRDVIKEYPETRRPYLLLIFKIYNFIKSTELIFDMVFIPGTLDVQSMTRIYPIHRELDIAKMICEIFPSKF